MDRSVRSLNNAVRARDGAAVEARLATLADCSLMAPPDPGGATLDDAVTPERPAPNEHLATITVYGFIETACRNYQQAAEHLAVGFDDAAAANRDIEIGVGLQLLSSGGNFTRLVASELERNWGLKVPTASPPPAVDAGTTDDSEAKAASPEPPPRSDSSATPNASGPPVFSSGEMRFVAGFRTPSGNIVCGQYETGIGTGRVSQWLNCGVLDAEEAWQLGDYPKEGSWFSLRAANLPDATSVPTLDYGKRWGTDSFECVSRQNALSCKNRLGNGYLLSRDERRGW
jgi:hypothetical protein